LKFPLDGYFKYRHKVVIRCKDYPKGFLVNAAILTDHEAQRKMRVVVRWDQRVIAKFFRLGGKVRFLDIASRAVSSLVLLVEVVGGTL